MSDTDEAQSWQLRPEDPPEPCPHRAVEVICADCAEHLGLMENRPC